MFIDSHGKNNQWDTSALKASHARGRVRGELLLSGSGSTVVHCG